MRRLERLGILLGLVVVGLGVSSNVPLPSPVLAFHLPGSLAPISITLTPARQVSLVVLFFACIGIDSILRADPRLVGAGLARTIPFWILPGIFVLVAFGLFEELSGVWPQVLGLAAAAGVLGLLVVAQLHTLDPSGRWFEVSLLGLNAVTYGLALAAFIVAYRLPARELLTPALVTFASVALALHLFETTRASNRRIWGSALLVGLMLGEVAWTLSRGILSPLVSAFLLLLVFYGATGIIQQHFWGRLRPQVAVEFAIVAAAILALIAYLG